MLSAPTSAAAILAKSGARLHADGPPQHAAAAAVAPPPASRASLAVAPAAAAAGMPPPPTARGHNPAAPASSGVRGGNLSPPGAPTSAAGAAAAGTSTGGGPPQPPAAEGGAAKFKPQHHPLRPPSDGVPITLAQGLVAAVPAAASAPAATRPTDHVIATAPEPPLSSAPPQRRSPKRPAAVADNGSTGGGAAAAASGGRSTGAAPSSAGVWPDPPPVSQSLARYGGRPKTVYSVGMPTAAAAAAAGLSAGSSPAAASSSSSPAAAAATLARASEPVPAPPITELPVSGSKRARTSDAARGGDEAAAAAQPAPAPALVKRARAATVGSTLDEALPAAAFSRSPARPAPPSLLAAPVGTAGGSTVRASGALPLSGGKRARSQSHSQAVGSASAASAAGAASRPAAPPLPAASASLVSSMAQELRRLSAAHSTDYGARLQAENHAAGRDVGPRKTRSAAVGGGVTGGAVIDVARSGGGDGAIGRDDEDAAVIALTAGSAFVSPKAAARAAAVSALAGDCTPSPAASAPPQRAAEAAADAAAEAAGAGAAGAVGYPVAAAAAAGAAPGSPRAWAASAASSPPLASTLKVPVPRAVSLTSAFYGAQDGAEGGGGAAGDGGGASGGVATAAVPTQPRNPAKPWLVLPSDVAGVATVLLAAITALVPKTAGALAIILPKEDEAGYGPTIFSMWSSLQPKPNDAAEAAKLHYAPKGEPVWSGGTWSCAAHPGDGNRRLCRQSQQLTVLRKWLVARFKGAPAADVPAPFHGLPALPPVKADERVALVLAQVTSPAMIAGSRSAARAARGSVG